MAFMNRHVVTSLVNLGGLLAAICLVVHIVHMDSKGKHAETLLHGKSPRTRPSEEREERAMPSKVPERMVLEEKQDNSPSLG